MILTTRQVNRLVRNYGRSVRNTGKLARGASRIPCPSPVVTNKKNTVEQPFSFMAGLDFLKVSLWLDWETPDFLRTLHDFKEEFQDEQLSTPYAAERSLDLGAGMKFNMQRTGAGKYTYVLKSGDVTLMFSNHKSTAPFPNCRIEIGSMSCWSPGWKYLFDRILSVLRFEGGTPRQQKVSEFHITADLFGLDYTTTHFDDYRRWICKASKWGMYGEDHTPNYFSYGKGDRMIRVYNKSAELASSEDSSKSSFFRELWANSCGGQAPEYVTRIEFQFRRAGFKDDFNINTVGQLEEHLNAVWQHSVNDWCRFTAAPITDADRKNKNHQRYENDALWDFVRSVQFSASAVLHIERKKKVRHVNVDSLRKIASGCFLSICGVQGMTSDDVEGHIAYCCNLIHHQFHEKYKENRNEYMRKIETKYNRAYVNV